MRDRMRHSVKLLGITGIYVVLATASLGHRSVRAAEPADADLTELLRGVTEIGAPGSPGSVIAAGERAFPVVVGGSGKNLREPVVAAGRMGQGRVVIFGHTGYLDPATQPAGTDRLVLNAIRWSSRQAGSADKAPPRVAIHGNGSLMTYLKAQHINATVLDGKDWTQRLGDFDVLCSNTGSFSTAEQSAVGAWVANGGGLLTSDTGWGWLQGHTGQTLADHPGNRMLAAAGLGWSDGFVNRTTEQGFKAEAAPPHLTHAGRALAALLAHDNGTAKLSAEDAAQAVWSVTRAVPSLSPDDKTLLPRLQRLREGHGATIVPTEKQPITLAQPLSRLVLTLQAIEAQRLPPEKVRAHPAAADFPGAPPGDAPRVTRTVEVDTKVPGWHSTGLYAAPGQIITVDVPDKALNAGLALRIGAHRDTLWGLDQWKRVPDLTRVFALKKTTSLAANAFGGPIYIEVPGGKSGSGGRGTLSLTIHDAVEAPHFKLGSTDLQEWRASIRQRPAPWAELEGKRVILTLPSEVVRGLDDPAALMQFWDDAMDAVADLATIPRERERPERYVPDRQISAGYMHSGYPIMTHMDVAPLYVDRAGMIDGTRSSWGFWHEVGHNHQIGDWTFGGTGEVTNNMFALYAIEKVLGVKSQTHPAISPTERAKRLAKYLAGGAKFEDWKRDPFLALTMYVQLQEAFGWDAYKKVFAEYRALKPAERPQNDEEKRDQWMVRFSRAVGRNLGPFFKAWGVPTSDKARASIAGLPAWMPENLSATAGPKSGNSGAKHTLIIGLDGTRPDCLKVAKAPHLAALIAAGAVTYDAYAGGIKGTPGEQPTVSGPGWSSILTGVWANKHNVRDNSFKAPNYTPYPHFFQRIKEARPNAVLSSIVHWAPIDQYITAASAAAFSLRATEGTDAGVAQKAAAYLAASDPDVLFLHFDEVDHAGHAKGYGAAVPEYLAAIEQVDAHIGTVLRALSSRKGFAREDWLILLTTDHGGINKGHGGQSPEERTIFIIAKGGGIEPREISPGPGHTAIPPTVMRHLGLTVDPAWGWDDQAFRPAPVQSQ